MKNPAYTILQYSVPEDFGSLWPDKWSSSHLYLRHQEIGSIEFNRGFRNIAIDLDASAVHPDWFLFKDLENDPHFLSRMEEGKLEFILSYDTMGTPSGKKEQDYASSVPLAVDPEEQMVYVISGTHYRATVKEQARRVIRESEKYEPFRALVEKASQAAVDEWVLELAPWMMGILEITKPTQQSKMQRLMGVTPLMESGKVVFNDTMDPYKKNNDAWNPANGSIYEELTDFPFAKHDDMVDAFSQGMHAARRYFLDWNATTGDNMIEVTVGRDGQIDINAPEEQQYLF